MRPAFAFICLALPLGAQAQGCPESPAIAANECLSRQLKTAEAEVAKIYGELLAGTPINASGDSGEAKKLLAQSHRTWLAHRKASCRYRGSVEGGAPSYKSVRENQCLVRMTESRAAELQEMLRHYE